MLFDLILVLLKISQLTSWVVSCTALVTALHCCTLTLMKLTYRDTVDVTEEETQESEDGGEMKTVTEQETRQDFFFKSSIKVTFNLLTSRPMGGLPN